MKIPKIHWNFLIVKIPKKYWKVVFVQLLPVRYNVQYTRKKQEKKERYNFFFHETDPPAPYSVVIKVLLSKDYLNTSAVLETVL